MAIFDTQANAERLNNGAAAWQQNNPRFRQILDSLSKMLYSKPAYMLDPSARNMLGLLQATAQNSIPGLGDPVGDFAAVNRALISGQIALTHYNPTSNTPDIRTSSGMGNVSVAATNTLLSSFEASMMTNGTLDTGKTHGLSQSMRARVLAGLISNGAVDLSKENAITTFDLSNFRTSKQVQDFLELEKRRNNTDLKKLDEGSLAPLEKVQKALAAAEEQFNAEGDDLAKNHSVLDITDFLSDKGFDQSTISQTIAQLKGKNTNFQTQTKRLKDAVGEAFESVAENIKDLSELFQTEDVDKLQEYARGLGVGSIVDKNNAAAVHNEMRSIAAVAQTTGRSVQEVAAERIQIASGLSAAYGGRAPDAWQTGFIADAGVAAAANGNKGIYTVESDKTHATRSLINMQNVFGGMISADAAMRYLGDNVDEATKAEYEQLVRERRAAGNDRTALKAVNDKMAKWARTNFGDTIDTKEFREYANSHMSEEVKDLAQSSLATRNIDAEFSKYRGVSEDKKDNLKSIASTLLDVYGNDDIGRNKLLDMIGTNAEEAKSKLMKDGMSSDEADKLIASVQEAGVGTTKKAMMATLSGSWTRQYVGKATVQARERQATADLLKAGENKDLSRDENKTVIQNMIAGMLEDGGLSMQDAIDLTVAKAFNGRDSAGHDYSDVGVFKLGSVDEANNRLNLDNLNDKEKENLYKALGVDAAGFEELNNKGVSHVIGALKEKGITLSNTRTDKGRGLVAVSEERAKFAKSKYDAQVEKYNLSSLVQAFGKDAINYDAESGQYQVRWNGKDINAEDFIATLGKDLDTDNSKAAFGELTKLANAGNKGAKDLISERVKTVAEGMRGKEDSAVKKLAAQNGDIDAVDLADAVRDTYGTIDLEAFNSVDSMVTAGLVSKTKDGKYIMNTDLQGIGATVKGTTDKDGKDTTVNFGRGAKVRGSELEELLKQAQPGMSEYKKLFDSMLAGGGGVGEPKGPTYDQMATVLQHLATIANNG